MIRGSRNFGSLAPGQRIVSMSAAVALNGAALVMLLLLRTQVPTSAGTAPGTSVMVSIAATPQSQKLPVVVKPRFQRAVAAIDVPIEVTAAAVSSAAGTAAECPITEDVAKGILADPAALDAIGRAPPETRSIADAIVVWNAVWAPATEPTATDAQAPLGPVRANVLATLQALSDECLSAIVMGPRLIAVPNGERSMILVFGSGEWSWQTLIDPVPLDSDQSPFAKISWMPGAFRYR